eukprot:13581152-Alexandrium_andersonii.AAC.1
MQNRGPRQHLVRREVAWGPRPRMTRRPGPRPGSVRASRPPSRPPPPGRGGGSRTAARPCPGKRGAP